QRQVGDARLDRRVAEHVLEVERDEEEHREQRHANEQADDVRPPQRAQAEDGERHQRVALTHLDRDKRRQEDHGGGKPQQRGGGPPSLVDGVNHGIDQERGPAVTVIAPGKSKVLAASSARLSLSVLGASAAAASPIGTLTNSTQRQLSPLVRTPPRRTPAAPPAPATAPQIPRARLRSAPSANVVVMIESAAGETMAAPRPWTARRRSAMPRTG